MTDVFKVDNSIPCKNGTIIRGKFLCGRDTKISPGDIYEAFQGEQRVGLVRLVGVMGASYSQSKEDPPWHLSVGFDGDYRLLLGVVLKTFTTVR